MDTLYLEAGCLLENGYVSTSCKSAICLFVLGFCKDFKAETVFVLQDKQDKSLLETFQLNITNLKARVAASTETLPYLAQACHLPALVTSTQTSCVASLCSVLRFLLRHCLRDEALATQLLGFRQGCLMACAEASVWTRFCEIDMVQCVETLLTRELAVQPDSQVHVPVDLMRFEVHMGEPLRIHNVDKDRVVQITFFLGGIMAGAASLLYLMRIGVTKYNAGFLLGVKAFTAAVLGGIGNVRGALLGGFVLGLAENYGSALIGTQWKDVVAFLLLVVILLFRPTGLLGESLGRSRA